MASPQNVYHIFRSILAGRCFLAKIFTLVVSIIFIVIQIVSVLIDKKPHLPDDQPSSVETPVVSQKFEPSPKRYLYASNTRVNPNNKGSGTDNNKGHGPRWGPGPQHNAKWRPGPHSLARKSSSDFTGSGLGSSGSDFTSSGSGLGSNSNGSDFTESGMGFATPSDLEWELTWDYLANTKYV